MIGIIGAMDEEVAKIVEAMEIERQEEMIRRLHAYGSKRNIRQLVFSKSTIFF